MLKNRTIKSGHGFKGVVDIYDNNRFMYSILCRTIRLTEQSALIDAKREAHDLLLDNGVCEFEGILSC